MSVTPTPAHAPGLLRAVLVASLLLVRGAAIEGAPPAWTPVPLPGGVTGLMRVLGGGDADPALALVETIRRIDVVAENDDSPRSVLRRYFRTLQDVSDRARSLEGGGVSLTAAAQKASRQRVQDLLAAMGLRLNEGQNAPAVVEAAGGDHAMRRRMLESAGLDVTAVMNELNAGQTVEVVIPSQAVPVPLTPASWGTYVFDEAVAPGALASRILTDRRAGLLYHGLAALDPETLALFASQPHLLKQCLPYAPVFAAFAGSLRVRNGRLILPGGDAADGAWQQLAGIRADDPARSVAALVQRDAGRLAWFYETLAQLEPERVRSVLALDVQDVDNRKEQAEASLRLFTDAQPEWHVDARPFMRPAVDPALWLAELIVPHAGEAAGLVWRRFWDRALESTDIPDQPAKLLARIDEDGRADAGWLGARVFRGNDTEQRIRSAAVLFAQRTFGRAPVSSAPDQLVAVRGFQRFPVLLLTLEHMGVTAPATYAAAVRHAAILMSAGPRPAITRLLSQFQGALFLLDRMHTSHALDDEQANGLVLKLAAVPIGEAGYDGGIVQWLDAALLPTLATAPTEEAAAEPLVLDALAGTTTRSAARAAPVIQWEGYSYRVDPAGGFRVRLEQVRTAQGGYSLEHVLRLSHAASVLSRASSLDTVRQQLDRLRELQRSLPRFERDGGPPDAPDVPDVAGTLEKVTSDLGRVDNPKKVKNAAKVASRLVALADALLSDWLTAAAYAIAVAPGDDETLRTVTVSRRHDFGLSLAREDERRYQPWLVGRPVVDAGPWHVTGALLGLDLALAEAQLRRVDLDREPPASQMDAVSARVFAQNVAVLDARGLDDTSRDGVADALARGRARLADRLSAPTGPDEIADAGRLGPWRREALRWMDGDADRAERVITLVELLRLGQDSAHPVADTPGWGTVAMPIDLRLGARIPPAVPWETRTGRWTSGLLASHTMDLTLRLTEALARLHLPASLLPAVLSPATYDFVREARMAWPDDELGLSRSVRDIPDARIEDYVASLANDGPLVAVAHTSGSSR